MPTYTTDSRATGNGRNYPVENSVELSVENEAFAAIDPPNERLYTREELLHCLWVAFRLDEQQFKVIRYKLNVPEATCEDMAVAMAMTKQALHKIIKRIKRDGHILSIIFPNKKPKSH